MKHIDSPDSFYNVYHRNAASIKEIERDLWDVMAEIKLNNYQLREIKNNKRIINRKFELEKEYQRLSNLYCFSNPFSNKLILNV